MSGEAVCFPSFGLRVLLIEEALTNYGGEAHIEIGGRTADLLLDLFYSTEKNGLKK
jgi:hypothetical protein